jgi:hypothetical protein
MSRRKPWASPVRPRPFIREGGRQAPFGFFGATTMTKTTTTEPAAAEQSDVVLFGLDETGKPRAARFHRQHAELAAKAAGVMGLTVCTVSSPELTAIAPQLPAGRIHANGRGFVPNIRQDLYAKLIEASGPATKTDSNHQSAGRPAEGPTETSAPSPDAASPAPGGGQGYPRDWDDISVGHLVIAYSAADEGWWEAIVIAREGDMLTMRFRDYPKDPKLVQHRTAVALLKPGTP